MSNHDAGATFSDFCVCGREKLKMALLQRRMEYYRNEKKWNAVPCSKKESMDIALEIYDELASYAKGFARAAGALEIVMKNHGLELDKGYSLQEYIEAEDFLRRKEEQESVIMVVK